MNNKQLPTIEQTVTRCLIDNEYISAPEMVTILEPLRLKVEGEYRLWKGKERFLEKLLNQALTQDLHNATVDVALEQYDDNSFVIALTVDYKLYHGMWRRSYLGFGDEEDEIFIATENDAFYLEVMEVIFNSYKDKENRLEAIQCLFEENYWENYSMFSFRPKYRLEAFDAVLIDHFGLAEDDTEQFQLVNCEEDEDSIEELMEEASDNGQDVFWTKNLNKH